MRQVRDWGMYTWSRAPSVADANNGVLFDIGNLWDVNGWLTDVRPKQRGVIEIGVAKATKIMPPGHEDRTGSQDDLWWGEGDKQRKE